MTGTEKMMHRSLFSMMLFLFLQNTLITGNPVQALLKRSWVYSDTYNCEKVYSCFNTKTCHERYSSTDYFCANIYPCGSSCAPNGYRSILRPYELLKE
uniref:ShKT domain-containing protein n=1 Tax=Trichobilharzia regenti TaxID=157069 RepID=A0AA85IXZ5_TRIRE|nr:unnamed protein product [Trichobilharzia regenti]